MRHRPKNVLQNAWRVSPGFLVTPSLLLLLAFGSLTQQTYVTRYDLFTGYAFLDSPKVGLFENGLRIPMMSISHSDLMPIRSERSDAGLSQCETVIGISQDFCLFSLS